METKTSAWTGQQFRNRLTVLSHAAVIMTLVTVWLIQLIDVLQPLFIALGIYFVLKPGADALSKKGFPIMLSYITMLMLAILIVLSAGFFAYQQADNFLSDDERMDEYTLLLDERWSDLKEMPLVGKSLWMRVQPLMEPLMTTWQAWAFSMRVLEFPRPSTDCSQASGCSSSPESPSCFSCSSSSLKPVCSRDGLNGLILAGPVNAST